MTLIITLLYAVCFGWLVGMILGLVQPRAAASMNTVTGVMALILLAYLAING